MDGHSEVAPDTLAVDLRESGVVVEYLDGREAFYRGVPDSAESPYQTAPGKDVHVLVTDDSGDTGVVMYVDERTTEADILETTGVGRVLLDSGESTTLFPGVTAEKAQHRITLRVDHTHVDGRVFVFEEDQFQERSVELVAEA